MDSPDCEPNPVHTVQYFSKKGMDSMESFFLPKP